MYKPIYPEVGIVNYTEKTPTGETVGIVKMRTTLRKQHNGKWHRILFLRNYEIEPENAGELLKVVSRFHKEVYSALILYQIDPNAYNEYGMRVNPIDTDQRSEEERLKQLLSPPTA